MERISRGRAYVVLIVCNFFGGLAVYAGLQDYYLAKRTADWPFTDGQVVSSEVIGNYTDSVTSYWVYRPVIKYVYTVGGRQLSGDRLTFSLRQGSLQRSKREAQKKIAQYPEGHHVRVFYSPTDAAQSVLEPGAASGTLAPTLIGLLIMGFASTFVVSATGIDLLPHPIRFWLKTRKASDRSAESLAADSASSPAWANEIREMICEWNPGVFVRLEHSRTSSIDLLFYSAIVGSFIGIAIGTVLFVFKADSDWRLSTGVVNVFAVSTLLLFTVSRLQDRRTVTTIDWLSATYTIRRDLAFTKSGPIHEINQVNVRCYRPRKHVRRYFSVVELQLPTAAVVIAQNEQLRRKPATAIQHSANLARPLAAALGVPVTYVDVPGPNE